MIWVIILTIGITITLLVIAALVFIISLVAQEMERLDRTRYDR